MKRNLVAVVAALLTAMALIVLAYLGMLKSFSDLAITSLVASVFVIYFGIRGQMITGLLIALAFLVTRHLTIQLQEDSRVRELVTFSGLVIAYWIGHMLERRKD
jgi:uncharacterized membrane protein YGL010W